MMENKLSTKQVWELLSKRLRSFLLSRVSDEHVASDLLQETFLRIHKNLNTIDDEQRLQSWVFQIARNLVTDYYRTKHPAGTRIESEPRADTGEPENLNEEVVGWIATAINHLPDTYREAVRLHEVERLTGQEIADRLGMSLSGAKSRVQRGRDKLKQLLHECCSFELDSRGNIIDYEKKNTTNCCDDCEDTGSACP